MRYPLVVLFALVVAGPVRLQVRRSPQEGQQQAKRAAVIALKAGGDAYDFSGPAVCEHMPSGSIYDTPAERWTVTHDGDQKSLLLTVWRPLKGGDMMVTLHVTNAGKTHDVNTVKGARTPAGSGSATFTAAGSGGTFTIDATGKSGEKIVGTVKCDGFTVPNPVAG